MPATFSIPTQTVIPGQLITAALWNGEFGNIYDNLGPAGVDDYASTDGEYQTQTDPYPGSVLSKPTSLAAELERIRYEIAQMKGKTYHYQPSDITIAQAAELYKPGMIIAYGGSAAPSGWLLCDGSAVSRTTYAALFAVISENFGQGDNSTTFNVPDLRGRFLRGVDGGAGNDPDAASRTAIATGGNTGDAVGSLQGEEYKSHTHTQDAHGHGVTDPGHAHTERYASGGATAGGMVSSAGDGSTNSNSYNTTLSQVTGISIGSTTATNQNSGGNETRPKNVGVHYIIKT